ncbi:transcription factor Thi1 [Schizosaccharomyces cryophilus OY26]|uniref:Transcription factor Thi1 n=1 Tax=Schizosaccharomyces cryophilus (strain OY26 / ATCC MYA-4695 / CBS 11777 / NBRC 106824 / NRRL Y48691) TaxID=653667 RepID=S9VWZ6_SCHCR|nr:transcription factor Thi1 [Schizosaccharomyces cryophilus OY26]EPY52178.1 transcription factor Thi1 [Schizosaccharomyces cryophilus OY26]
MNENLGFIKTQLYADVKAFEKKKKRRVPPEQRRRVFRACKHCREKKIKCDGNDSCENCRLLGVECIYTQKNQSKLPSREYLNELSERQLCFEYIFSRICPEFNLDTKNLVTVSKKLSEHEHLTPDQLSSILNDLDPILSINNELKRNHISNHDDNYVSEPNSIDPNYSHESLENEPSITFVESLLVGKMEDTMYLGPTSLDLFLKNIQNDMRLNDFSSANSLLQNQPTSSFFNPELDEYLLSHARGLIPSLTVTEFLVNTFFTNIQTNLFFYHASFFKIRLEIFLSMKNQTDPGFLCILLMVLAFGNQYMIEQQSDPVAASPQVCIIGNRLFSAAVSIFPMVLLQGNTNTVQSAILIALYLQPTVYQKASYSYFGLAVKTAISLGLHKNCEDLTLSQSSRELRNRLWWSVFCIDRFISIAMGRPFSIALENVTTPYPNVLFELEVPGIPSMVTNMRAVIELTKITSEVCDCLYWKNSSDLNTQLSHVRRLCARLELWKRNLHHSLLFDESSPQNPYFRVNAQLQMIYDNAVILATRFVLLNKLKGKDLSAENLKYASMCVDSSCRMINIAYQLFQNTRLSSYSFFDAYLPICSGIILLLCSHNEPSVEVDDAVSKLWKVMEFLSQRNEITRLKLQSLRELSDQLTNKKTFSFVPESSDFQFSFRKWQSWVGDMSQNDYLQQQTASASDAISVDEGTLADHKSVDLPQPDHLSLSVPNTDFLSDPSSLLVRNDFSSGDDLGLNIDIDKQWPAPPFLSWTELLHPSNESNPPSNTDSSI